MYINGYNKNKFCYNNLNKKNICKKNNCFNKKCNNFNLNCFFEIENFLCNFKNICKGIKLYKFFK